jgi:hypothetical protein
MNKKFQIIALLCVLNCGAFGALAQSRRSHKRRAAPRPPADLIARVDEPRIDVRGKLVGQNYTNDYLGFSLTLPAGWQPQADDVQELLMDRVRRKSEDLHPVNQAAAEDSIARTTTLLIAIKPTDGLRNQLLMAAAEDIRVLLNVRTSRQYLEQMRKSFGKESPIAFGEPTTEVVGGVEYGVMGAGRPDPQTGAVTTVVQYYYITIRKNHALGFILTPSDSEHLQECKDVLASVKFQ